MPTSDRVPGIIRAIDEIAFHTSILALNAAVARASEQEAPAPWNAQAAAETLALIEESITRAQYREPVAVPKRCAVPAAAAHRELETETEALHRVAERIRCMRSAAPATKRGACAAYKPRSFVDPR